MIRRNPGQAARRHPEDPGGSLAQLPDVPDDREALEVDEHRRHLAIGPNVWDLTGSETPKQLLGEYLAFAYSLRGLEPGAPIKVPHRDLEVLEETIGWSTDRIAGYLVNRMLEQNTNRRVQPTSRAKEKTRDTIEELRGWWNS